MLFPISLAHPCTGVSPLTSSAVRVQCVLTLSSPLPSSSPPLQPNSFPSLSALVSVGVLFSGPLDISWSGDGLSWQPSAAGPVFAAGYSDWNRNANSTELFGYPSLTTLTGTGLDGGMDPSQPLFAYVTYLPYGANFNARWLVRRPVSVVIPGAGGVASPPALAALSVWTCGGGNCTGAGVQWVTTGPVTPYSGYTVTSPAFGYMATSAWVSPGGEALLGISECALPRKGNTVAVVALVGEGECGKGAFGGGLVLRPAGWVASSSSASSLAAAWHNVTIVSQGPSFSSQSAPLWRCVRAGDGTYSATVGDASCVSAGKGFTPDALLGYALAPFTQAQ